MSTLWIDCKYGIAGDMLLAALVDLGADEKYIKSELDSLDVDRFDMKFVKRNMQGIEATYLNLDFEEEDHVTEHNHGHAHSHDHYHRHAKDIYQFISNSSLSKRVKEQSIALFEEIARAEGKIHGISPELVHFHEVGAMDSIIDIIGVCIALDYLNIDEIIATPVPTGNGMIQMAHGLYPIPAPATSEILIGVPLSDFECTGELTTPTGAAFLKVLVDEFITKPDGIIEKIGYGAGTREYDHPNVVRVMKLKK